jgi:hypothetical protein
MPAWRICTRYALLTALFIAGCSNSRSDVTPVSGRVTLDGRALSGARLMFQPEASGGSPSYGTTDQEGRYELGYKRGEKGALIGMHLVRIELGVDARDGGNKGAARRVLPVRYNTESDLRREVKAVADNNFDFDLKSEAK